MGTQTMTVQESAVQEPAVRERTVPSAVATDAPADRGIMRRRHEDHVETRAMLDLVRFLMVRPSVEQIAQHLVLRILAPFHPRGILVSLCAPDGTLHLAASFGFGPDAVAPFERLSLWEASPMSEAVRTGDPVVIATAEETERRYPWLPSEAMPASPLAAWPLTLPNERVGVVEVLFGSPVDTVVIGREIGGIAAILALYLSLTGTLRDQQRDAAAPLADHAPHGGAGPRPSELSARQRQILELMAHGLTNTQIALRVGYSDSTVRQETMAIYRYFDVDGRREAVRVATMRGMLSDEAR